MWPKQLEIRNTPGGLIWQVFHVMNQDEIKILTRNAKANAFQSVEVDDEISHEETFPGWRDTPEWKQQLQKDKA